MRTFIVVNDAGEYFAGFSKSSRFSGHEPKFVPFTSPAISVQLMDESELSEMEADLKLFNINYRLIEVNK